MKSVNTFTGISSVFIKKSLTNIFKSPSSLTPINAYSKERRGVFTSVGKLVLAAACLTFFTTVRAREIAGYSAANFSISKHENCILQTVNKDDSISHFLAQEDKIVRLLKQELEKQFNKLAAKDYPPYFMSLRLADVATVTVSANLGSLTDYSSERNLWFVPQIRVGSPSFDNFRDLQNGAPSNMHQPPAPVFLPLNFSIAVDAVIDIIDKEIDNRYNFAVRAFESARNRAAVVSGSKDTTGDFTHAPAEVFYRPAPDFKGDEGFVPEDCIEEWKVRVRTLSALFDSNIDVLSATVSLKYDFERRYFISTEGTSVVENRPYIMVSVNALGVAPDGMVLPMHKNYFAYTFEELPSDSLIIKDIEYISEKISQLVKAPVVQAYSGPALLSGSAAGVFFHEIFGHRIEGQRLKSDMDGQTFKHMTGEKVLPAGLNVTDDPSLRYFKGTPLYGHYLYDEQGVKGVRTEVVKDGVLHNFLMTRTPINGHLNSNGHARADYVNDPTSRQSNLIIETTQPYSFLEMRNMLIREIVKSGKEFGYYFKEVTGGFTQISSMAVNSFNVLPLEVYRVYADGSEDELVRGVDLIGTPLSMFSNIVNAGGEYEVFTGVCGASSGGIPVTAVAPTIMVSNVELQSKPKSPATPPLLPRNIVIVNDPDNSFTNETGANKSSTNYNSRTNPSFDSVSKSGQVFYINKCSDTVSAQEHTSVLTSSTDEQTSVLTSSIFIPKSIQFNYNPFAAILPETSSTESTLSKTALSESESHMAVKTTLIEIDSKLATNTILNAMESELARSMQQLLLPGSTPPYYILYTLTENSLVSASATIGGLITSHYKPAKRHTSVNLYVGDNTLSSDYSYSGAGMISPLPAPIDNSAGAIRNAFWYNSDIAYKFAADVYNAKRNKLRSQSAGSDEKDLPEILPLTDTIRQFEFDDINDGVTEKSVQRCQDLAIELSKIFLEYPNLSSTRVSATELQSIYYITSGEGTRIRIPVTVSYVNITASLKVEGGKSVSDFINIAAPSFNLLPSFETLAKSVREFADGISSIEKSSKISEYYYGPVLFEDYAVSTIFLNNLFSEAALFAYRKPIPVSSSVAAVEDLSVRESLIPLERRMGERILDPLLNVCNRTDIYVFKNAPLIGAYDIDVQGVRPVSNLNLIEKGILKNVLGNRIPTLNSKSSTGSMRAGIRDNSMSVSLAPGVITVESSAGLAYPALKRELLKRAKSQGLDYAYIVRKFMGGDNQIIYRVSVKSGSETPVTGARLMPVPLSKLNNIGVKGISKELSHENTMYRNTIPISIVFPKAILLNEIEIMSN